MIVKTKQKTGALDLTETDMVYDHAVYSKALAVLLDVGNNDLKENAYMCTFIAVIGKVCKNAGFVG